jgi:predicted homoserine dehydrogenase-like protein
LDIRKISIGSDYKSGAMHYIVGQEVLGGSYVIHLIQHDKVMDSYKIWIMNGDEVLLWKEFKMTMPISLEYNINF